jgi:peroxiredoxin
MKQCFLAILILLVIGCKNNETNKNKFTFDITVIGKDTGSLFFQFYNSPQTSEKVSIKNGKASFTSQTIEPSAGVIFCKENGISHVFYIFSEPNAKMKVLLDFKTDKVVVSGSKINDEYYQLEKNKFATLEAKEKQLFANIDPKLFNNPATFDSLQKLSNLYKEQRKQIVIDYIAANKNSYVGLGLLFAYNLQTLDLAMLKTGFASLSSSLQSTTTGQAIVGMINHHQKAEVGENAPNFTLPSSKKVSIKLSEFCKNKKLVLVDFWASWCGPCRNENPNVVAAYNKFKNKGFDIISVSIDEDANKWMKAVEDDKLSWLQVNDNKGWESPTIKEYGVSGIPSNFLIDNQGKILAKNLRGPELDNKIEEFLK